jgi:hypothetical protein
MSKKLEALDLLREDIPKDDYNKLKRKYLEEEEKSRGHRDSTHFEKIKSFIERNIKGELGGKELVGSRVLDSRIGKQGLEYLIEFSDEHGNVSSEWKPLKHFESSRGADITRFYETVIQYEMGLKYYQQNRNLYPLEKDWFIVCYNRIYEDNSREDLEKLVKSQKDILFGGVFTVKKGEEPFIGKSSRKIRNQMSLGDSVGTYSPTKPIPKPDNVDFMISSPNQTHHVKMYGTMLDTGCDLTEVHPDIVDQLQLPQNYVSKLHIVNGETCKRYNGCLIQIGNNHHS